mmetsp:Transcript_15009/g.32353  ORF Transcript_15009/g.32353 Transcript_15009/m.32353 type:complete len:367 (-) Transcript_15009:177-1277(-)
MADNFRGEEYQVGGGYRGNDLNHRILSRKTAIEIVQNDQQSGSEGDADAHSPEGQLEEREEALDPSDVLTEALDADLVEESFAEYVEEDHRRSIIEETFPRYVNLKTRGRPQFIQEHCHGNRIGRRQNTAEGHAQIEGPSVGEDEPRHQRRERRPGQHHGKRERQQLRKALREEMNVDVERIQIQQSRQKDEQYDLPVNPQPRHGRLHDVVRREVIQLVRIDRRSDGRSDDEHEGRVRDLVGEARHDVVTEDSDDLGEPREEDGLDGVMAFLGDFVFGHFVLSASVSASVASSAVRRRGRRVVAAIVSVSAVVAASVVIGRFGVDGTGVVTRQNDPDQHEIEVVPFQVIAESLSDALAVGMVASRA